MWLFLMLLFALVCVSNGSTVRCKTINSGRGLQITGFQTNEEFEQINCFRRSVKMLSYTDCKTDSLRLDVMVLRRRYPYLRLLSWQCDGTCVYYGDTGDFIVSGLCSKEGN